MNYSPSRIISRKTLLLFTRQLATLVNAGLPLLQSLLVLAKQESDSLLKKTVFQLIDSIQSGSSLSEALAAHPKVFSKLYVNMIKAAEEGGILGIVLQRLTNLQESSEKIKNKISSLFLYPIIVLSITLVIMGFLLTFVVPKFEATFIEMLHGKQLPLLTQLIISMSRGARNYLIQILTLFFISFVVFKFFLKIETVKRISNKLVLKIPLFGSIAKKKSLAFFARTLGMLTENGVPLLQALHITEETASNSLMRDAIIKIYNGVQEGDALITPMAGSSLFPPMVISMIAVGEETGELSKMLLGVATIYESEVDDQITRLLVLIEPLMILFLALIIGIIVIALFLPMVTMMSEFSLGDG
ncbi:MAG: type II secretion system F family protein [Chthoniobacterales bacterium]